MEIFDKETRKNIQHRLKMCMGTDAQEYVKALEKIAVDAEVYLRNSTPANALLLDEALDKVDRMRK